MNMALLFRKLSYRARIAAYKARFATGLGRSLHRNRPGGRILIYHGIDTAGSTQFNSRFVSQASFRQHVAYFAEQFHTVPLHRYFAGERAPDRLTIALTFDDGYRNNLELALPVLEEFNVPATFFITTIRALGKDHLWTDWVDLGSALTEDSLTFSGRQYRKNRHGQLQSGRTTLNRRLIGDPALDATTLDEVLPSEKIRLDPTLGPYWHLMDELDLKALASSPLVTLGSHGLTHASFAAMPRPEVMREMSQSKSWLENVVGKPIDAIAFPFGHYTRDTLDDAESLGFKYQLAVDLAHPDDRVDPRVRPRFGMNPSINWNLQLAAILKGRY